MINIEIKTLIIMLTISDKNEPISGFFYKLFPASLLNKF